MKDANRKELIQGQKAYYRPDMDATEEMFGDVPNELAGDVCTVIECSNPTKAVIQFEGYTRTFKVHSGSLVGIAATPAAE
jgi:hypothetical protein